MSPTGCHLVGKAKTRNRRMACAPGPDCEKQGKKGQWILCLRLYPGNSAHAVLGSYCMQMMWRP